MTEIDALRIISRLGGNLNILRNRDVAARLIRDLVREKVRRHNEVNVPAYNEQLKYGRGDFAVKQLLPIPQEKFTRWMST